MMKFQGSKTVLNSYINKPVFFKILSIESITSSEVEVMLSDFIQKSESVFLNDTNLKFDYNSTDNQAAGFSSCQKNKPVLSQLKRIQRDLRGLPSVIEELGNFHSET